MNLIQVLVVGSAVGKRNALIDILEECGLKPVIASNLGEVRNILGRRPIHVVFCEDNLPEGGFREILRLVKANRPEVQVVLSSMLGDVDEYIEAMNLGAFDFVAPPYRRPEIVTVVDSASRRYRLKRKDEAIPYDQTEVLVQGGKLPA
ncbi:MAG: two component, sigma54 specific, transcriptional regulator, Fis family [Candidatus Sulfotelmatobacter sp.]|nr:two component, sigma54 specific, transcriptional regulator, Fis family [Candidatus Sulfotelmatobacter sp.]